MKFKGYILKYYVFACLSVCLCVDQLSSKSSLSAPHHCVNLCRPTNTYTLTWIVYLSEGIGPAGDDDCVLSDASTVNISTENVCVG